MPSSGSSAAHHIWFDETIRFSWVAAMSCSSTLASIVSQPGSAAPMYSPGCVAATAPRSVPVPVAVGGSAYVDGDGPTAGHETTVGAGSVSTSTEPLQVQVSSSRVAPERPSASTAPPPGAVAMAKSTRAEGWPLGVACCQPPPSQAQVSASCVPPASAPPKRTGALAVGL